jgi:hypothetical protein
MAVNNAHQNQGYAHETRACMYDSTTMIYEMTQERTGQDLFSSIGPETAPRSPMTCHESVLMCRLRQLEMAVTMSMILECAQYGRTSTMQQISTRG